MNVKGYLEYTQAPWGKLFYKLALHNLDFENKRILDFGSGFGITADALAKNNIVTAIEPNEEILAYRKQENEYEQICGSLEKLSDIKGCSYDVIICHNVLEYVDDRKSVLNEFHRLLKPEGVLSIIKHNTCGKIMQKAVFECDTKQAMSLIGGEKGISVNFGEINEYTLEELAEYCENLFDIKNVFGIRTFYGLQNNEIKTKDGWIEEMYDLECAAESVQALRDVAFFNHVIMKKI